MSSKNPQRQNNPPKAGNATVTHQQYIKQHTGPIPDPDALARYNQIQPDFAERIMRMAELEQKERHNLDKQIVSNQHVQHKRDTDTLRTGQYLALAAVLLVIGLCVYCFSLGFATQGASIAVAVIAAVAVAFLRNSNKSSSDNSETSRD